MSGATNKTMKLLRNGIHGIWSYVLGLAVKNRFFFTGLPGNVLLVFECNEKCSQDSQFAQKVCEINAKSNPKLSLNLQKTKMLEIDAKIS